MGQFSFLTQDSATSVSSRRAAKVYMVAPDGMVYKETDYEGYGVFGGKDFYSLLSDINGGSGCRLHGIKLAFGNKTDSWVGGYYPHGDNPKIVWPNLVRFKKNAEYDVRRGVVKGCPDQGWT